MTAFWAECLFWLRLSHAVVYWFAIPTPSAGFHTRIRGRRGPVLAIGKMNVRKCAAAHQSFLQRVMRCGPGLIVLLCMLANVQRML